MRVPNIGLKIGALLGFGVLCVLIFSQLFSLAGGRGPFYDPYEVKAVVPDAFNLVPNSDVRRDGIKIGRVTTIEPRGTDSVLNIEIDKKEQTPIYRDATVRVRTKTLVGESYIDVDPGTPSEGAMPEGYGLPVTAADEAVPLERILSAVTPQTRRNIRRTLRGVGGGLENRGNRLNRLAGAVRPTVADGGRLMEVLAPQRRRLATLIQDSGDVLAAFGERTEDLRTLVRASKRTAEVVADHDASLRGVFDALPRTLDRTRTSVGKLGGFSTRAVPVVRDLKVSTRQLAPAIRELAPAARDGRLLVREIKPFLRVADPLLDELAPSARALNTVLPALDAVLRQANPAISYLKPYSRDFAAFFSNIGGVIDHRDALGNIVRVHPMISDRQFTNYPKQLKDLADAFQEVGGMSRFVNRRENPYPKPDTGDNPQRFDGEYLRVTPDR